MCNIIDQKHGISVVEYDNMLRDEWDQFILHKALNSTFLHSRDFFDHNPRNEFDDKSLLFYKGREIVAVFPASMYKSTNNLVLHSHLRATYGGFVVSKQVGVKEAIEIVEQTILFARKKNADRIIVRNPFRIYHSSLCDETDYAMWFNGFKIKSREIETAINVNGDIRQIRSLYHKGTKYSVGKARKNVEVILSEDYKEFWSLLEKFLMDRHGKKPVHDYNSICELRDRVGKDKVLLFGAYYQNRLVGGNVVFNFNNTVLHGQYNAADQEFLHLGPLHAVVDYIVQWSNERGFLYFNMGTSNEDEGKKVNSGLFSYKEGFGAKGLLRETMILDL